jgi:hypothetical protein
MVYVEGKWLIYWCLTPPLAVVQLVEGKCDENYLP